MGTAFSVHLHSYIMGRLKKEYDDQDDACDFALGSSLPPDQTVNQTAEDTIDPDPRVVRIHGHIAREYSGYARAAENFPSASEVHRLPFSFDLIKLTCDMIYVNWRGECDWYKDCGANLNPQVPWESDYEKCGPILLPREQEVEFVRLLSYMDIDILDLELHDLFERITEKRRAYIDDADDFLNQLDAHNQTHSADISSRNMTTTREYPNVARLLGLSGQN